MAVEARLSSKGQVVIPKALRKALGLEPGDPVKMELLEGRKALLLPAVAPPKDVFVKAGRKRLDAVLKESRRPDERKIRSLLKALGVQT